MDRGQSQNPNGHSCLLVSGHTALLSLGPASPFGVEVRRFKHSNDKFCSGLKDTDKTWMKSAVPVSLHGSGSL